ncbi:MAG: DUF2071 domain-containing protein [Bacteroidetes bacterium]|nr:MAG: DUF2071 domain-containing protein [Bacteroidota bacterium]
MSPFLTARWVNLLNLTYRVPPALLQPHVPPGLELDVQNGHAFVSLVAFEFLDTRVRGIKIPGHVQFPEINLRFYVLHKGQRGVVFIKELVPRFCIALVARRVYNEPYQAISMRVGSSLTTGSLELRHELRHRGHRFLISARGKGKLYLPPSDSEIHYFKEHELGFGVHHAGHTLSYRVEHPAWRVYEQLEYELELDYGRLYGEKWAFLNHARPFCRCLAEGSAVKVFPPDKL